jgi:HK97 family phage major capsid protein
MNRNEIRSDLERKIKQLEAVMPDPAKMEERKALTSAIEQITNELRAFDKADEELRASKEAEERAAVKPTLTENSGWAGVRKALLGAVESGRRTSIDLSGIERRAWAGTGYGTAPGLIRALIDGGKLRSKCNIALGKNSVTVVPAMTTSPAIPVGSAPGATGTASDSSAVLAADSMTLKPWYSTLAIPMNVLLDGNIEAELPALFSDNFGAAIDKMVCVGAGTGSDGLGVFIASASGVTTSQDVTATGNGAAPVWANYVDAVMQVLALGGDPNSLALVVNPAVFATALGVTTNDPEKIEYMTRGTILGVPVILSSYGLTTLSSGSYVAVVGYFKHYTIAIAQEIVVDQIKTVGSDNVTFQAFMYMQGKPTIGSSFRRLKTGAG